MKKEPANLIKTQSFELAVYARGDEDSDKLALVLPGRLDTKDYIHMTSHVDMLAKLGFYALSFDPPGSWESPGTLEDYSTTNYLKAVNEVIDTFNRPSLLVGHSRGGAVSMLASRNPQVKAVVLAMANYGGAVDPGPSEIEGDYAVSYRDLPPGTSRTARPKKFKPSEQLKNFNGPKLLICATYDQFITPEKVKGFYDALDEPKTFLELDTKHDYRLYPDMIEAVNNAIGEFVKQL
jgi:dienelactone hydrolase